MDDGRDHDVQKDGGRDAKIVLLRPATSPPPLDPRLEELRNILSQAQPIDSEFSDDEVIQDEDKFRRRFGPGFRWNRRHREALMRLKRHYDLTDPEIKLFQHTGNLRRTPFGVQLAASPWIALWGGVQLAVFGLLFLALLFATLPNLVGAPSKAAKPLLGLGGLLLFCYNLYWFYIKPWRLQRQLDRERTQRGLSISGGWLQRDDRHPDECYRGASDIPARQRDPIHQMEPRQGDGDIHTPVSGVGAPRSVRVEGEQPGEQPQGDRGRQQQPRGFPLLDEQPGQVAADDLGHRRDCEEPGNA
jgi:hypothetical protein